MYEIYLPTMQPNQRFLRTCCFCLIVSTAVFKVSCRITNTVNHPQYSEFCPDFYFDIVADPPMSCVYQVVPHYSGNCRLYRDCTPTPDFPFNVSGYFDCSHLKTQFDIPALPDYVEMLNLGYTNLPTVNQGLLFNVSTLNLVSLHLGHAGIKVVEKGALRWIKQLQCLNLDGNDALGIESFREFLSIPGLKRLTAKGCGFPIIDVAQTMNATSSLRSLWLNDNIFGAASFSGNSPWFQHFHLLSHLDLQTTGIKYEVGQISTQILNLRSLDLTFNMLKLLPPTCKDFDFESNRTSLFPFLTKLYLASNKINRIEDICLPSLQYLDLNDNIIGIVLLYASSGFTSLTGLFLDGNSIDFGGGEDLTSNVWFQTPTHMKNLSLDNNDFSGVDEHKFLKFFGRLRSLINLSLSNTHLGTVTANMFSRFVNLSTLLLGKNAIMFIPDACFDTLRNLRSLDLSSNAITTIQDPAFNHDSRSQFSLLDLSNNPMVCDCDILDFKDWFVSSKHIFKPGFWFTRTDPRLFINRSYTCTDGNGRTKELAAFTMPKQACVMKKEVSIQIITINCLIILSFTAATLLFRYRWHLRLVLYEVFRGRGDARQQYLAEGNFNYDVFVSYASEDLPWVREHLMPELEDRVGLRLCIHERDFIPGHNIVDNIVDCLESSKKVMMVFSRDFVLSQWCQFELALALTHVMEHEDALIVVCVDDVVSRDMTPAMMAVLKTTTYIQWEEHGDAVRAFWGRLHLALHEVIDNDHLNQVNRRQALPQALELQEVIDHLPQHNENQPHQPQHVVNIDEHAV